DPVNGRFDAHLAEVVLRTGELRPILSQANLLRMHLLLALGKRRLGDPDVVLRAIERFTRGQLALPQSLLPPERLLCNRELHARGLDALPGLLERGLRALQRRLAAVDARAQRARIDLHQKLAGLYAIAFVHREIHDAARGVGADVHEQLWLNL